MCTEIRTKMAELLTKECGKPGLELNDWSIKMKQLHNVASLENSPLLQNMPLFIYRHNTD